MICDGADEELLNLALVVFSQDYCRGAELVSPLADDAANRVAVGGELDNLNLVRDLQWRLPTGFWPKARRGNALQQPVLSFLPSYPPAWGRTGK